jgi:hypothetical protein
VLAVNVEEVASPLELVVTTHSFAVGFPPEQVANEPDAPDVGAVKVTLAPETGLPYVSVTFATSGDPKAVWTVADWGEPEDSAIAAGGPEPLKNTDSIRFAPDVVLPRSSVALTNTV